ncbi:MAG: membrane dipeptidase [Candidatus Latescibacterota bacterium]|nr:membrane dipeptidase [Candidatus Latescibacterota bacterium]MEE2725746.1 membrane dipeptidase [Candidatus Latescibacterota bacterium]
MNDTMPACVADFVCAHPLCDMLGLNLTHPRFAIDHIDLGKCDESTCRGDFVKFAEWGMRVVMCKGGPVLYDDNFASLWPRQPEHRKGRAQAEPLYLSSAYKHPTQVVLALLDRFLCDVEANADKVRLVHTVADLDQAARDGVVALLMGSNRADWFGDVPGVLRMAARLGLRMITLNGSGRELGWDGHDIARGSGGLSDLGAAMIDQMNRSGILIDLAHTNEASSLDIIAHSQRPVIDSHSNPRALEESTRNTSDAVMRALADRGGLLGIMPGIARPQGEQPYTAVDADQLAGVMRHINYAVDVMGIEGVGIGTHFNSASLPWLIEAVLEGGYAEADAAKIFGENYMRVLREVLPA